MKLIQMFIGVLIILSIGGCSNSFEEMRSAYDNKRYHDAIKAALKGYENPELRGEVLGFLENHGEVLIDELINTGEQLESEGAPSDNSIEYWKELDSLLRQMQEAGLPPHSLDDQQIYVVDLLKSSTIRYVRELDRQSIDAFEKKEFRKSINIIQKIKSFHMFFPGMEEREKDAEQLARRKVTLSPVIKPSKKVDRFYSETVVSLLRNPPLGQQEIVPIPLYVEKINVPKELTRKLLDTLKTSSSKFMNFSVDSPVSGVKGADYYVETFMDTKTEFSKRTPVYDETIVDSIDYSYRDEGALTWRTSSFSYDIYAVTYKVKVSVRAGVYLAQSQHKVKSIHFDWVEEEVVRYREKAKNIPLQAVQVEFPKSYLEYPSSPRRLDKGDVVSRAIKEASIKLTDEILSVVDTDLDPVLSVSNE